MGISRTFLLVGAGILLAGFPGSPEPEAQVPDPGPRRQGYGFIHLDFQGNRRICARMHEPELVKIMFPESYPQRQFTTLGYRLQVLAHHRDLETMKYLVIDSGKVETVGKKPISRPRTARNPLPGPLDQKSRKGYLEFWVNDSACYDFPEFQDISLPVGVYEMELIYSVRGPNGSWFRLIEFSLPGIPVLRGQRTPVIAVVEDNGRDRVIEFSVGGDPVPAETGSPEGDPDLEEKKAAQRSLDLESGKKPDRD